MGTRKYTKEALTVAVAESNSRAEAMRKLGIPTTNGGMSRYIGQQIKFFHIDTSHFGSHGFSGVRYFRPLRSPEEVLVLSDKHYREQAMHLRRAMLGVGFDLICECGQGPFWKGEPLVLEIDHRNGNCLDNRKENLRFICHNCHAQTPNHRAKNAIHKKKDPLLKRTRQIRHSRSKSAAPGQLAEVKKTIAWPSDEDLLALILSKPKEHIANELGVSGSALGKRIRVRGIDAGETGKRGYWQKQKAAHNQAA